MPVATILAAAGADLGRTLPLWSGIPFAAMLLSIALFPLAAPHFWHHHYPKVAAFWSVVFMVPFVWAYGGAALHEFAHIMLADYVPFLTLLFGLYTVAGGIVVGGTLRGSPAVNTAILLVGTLMASWIGTTGAAMVLIRPLLRANARRRHRVHTVVFFIFLVANVGGLLTPLGDPPLFLGFLQGVPFFWTLSLWHDLVLCAGILLPVFFLLDLWYWRREPAEAKELPAGATAGLHLRGVHNFLLLGGILVAVLMSGLWRPGEVVLLGVHRGVQDLLRDGAILVIGAVSLWTTKRELRRANEFSWGPVREVAYLFFGIFATIIPVLAILKAGDQGALQGVVRIVQSPRQFFWATGLLSSFLDNAPTYLTFLTSALGQFHPGLPTREAILALIAERAVYLEAISLGAVFMGANTYIGNAPNFMVKAIAEEAGLKMPSFFGYIVVWTVPFLLPVFVIVAFTI